MLLVPILLIYKLIFMKTSGLDEHKDKILYTIYDEKSYSEVKDFGQSRLLFISLAKILFIFVPKI